MMVLSINSENQSKKKSKKAVTRFKEKLTMFKMHDCWFHLISVHALKTELPHSHHHHHHTSSPLLDVNAKHSKIFHHQKSEQLKAKENILLEKPHKHKKGDSSDDSEEEKGIEIRSNEREAKNHDNLWSTQSRTHFTWDRAQFLEISLRKRKSRRNVSKRKEDNSEWNWLNNYSKCQSTWKKICWKRKFLLQNEHESCRLE